jgi:hypothetical protein
MANISRASVCALLLGAGLLVGCTSNRPDVSLNAFGDIPIDDQFEEFWSDHGGLSTFGPPIEPARGEGSLLRQMFLNAELVIDRNASSGNSVELAPLGKRLGLAEPPVSPQSAEGSRYFPATGHMLYAGFTQAYDEVGGQAVAGAPISEVKFRDGKILQYFENLGLYREENDAPSEVRLLALGLAARPERLASLVGDVLLVLPPEIMLRPFGQFMDRFGGESLFGHPLTEPFFTQDGAVEQIYQRAAFYSSVRDPSVVLLRPLGESLGPADAPAPQVDDPDSLYFSETGHNVQWAFAEFYQSNSGEEILGLPLEESHIEDGLLVQRFQNTVLTYHYDLPEHLAVQFAALGTAYLESIDAGVVPPTPVDPGSTPTAAPDAAPTIVDVTTWPERPLAPIGNPQWIWIEVLLPDGTPWVDVVPLLVVHGPRSDFYPSVPATGTEGRTSLVLVMEDLQPGEVVNYDVIVSGEFGIGHAQGQFAAIWSVPTP